MKISINLNGKPVTAEIDADMSLYAFVRSQGCFSVKCGCDTTNCGLCTVLVDDQPQLSCSYPAMRANGKNVTTLEGLQEEIKVFAGFMADQGADQCGYCNPGFLMNVMAMERELTDPTMEDIKNYLAGNLCRCSGYESQHRAIANYIAYKKSLENGGDC